MKFTELAEYEFPEGRVTRFTPRSDVPVRGWGVDARPLAYDHEHHVRGAVRGNGKISWLGAVFEVHEPFDPQVLTRVLLAWHRRHEAFRTTVTRGVDEAGDYRPVRRTYSADGLTFASQDMGRFPRDEVAAGLTAWFDDGLSPLDWPHCLVATITEIGACDREDRFLLVFAADHSVMDAYSMLLSITELSRLYASEFHGRPVELPEIGSHVDFSARDRGIGAEIDGDHEAVRRWRHFLGEAGSFPSLALPAGVAAVREGAGSDGVPQQGWVRKLADAEQMGTLATLSRAAGHTTQTAVIAALAVAHQELTGGSRLRLVMPMHTRHEARFLESVGWYVGIGPLEVDVSFAGTFRDALAAAAVGIAEAKRLSRLPYPRIAELLGTSAEPQFVVSYLDLRSMSGAGEWTDLRAQTVRSAARSDTEVYFWLARTSSGITASARFPAGAHVGAAITSLVSASCGVLREVIEHGVDRVIVSTTERNDSAGTAQPA
ncbi:condensation domain-containing protein [Millisia brevis]|uniref:condensation domain-containing protein n=1 Tax=Millisia brevis TaxID=264148 RepID=UPI000A015CFE|nr:condensation domain-containing protein [Millisia brevis]